MRCGSAPGESAYHSRHAATPGPADDQVIQHRSYGNHCGHDSVGLRDAVEQGKLKKAIWSLMAAARDTPPGRAAALGVLAQAWTSGVKVLRILISTALDTGKNLFSRSASTPPAPYSDADGDPLDRCVARAKACVVFRQSLAQKYGRGQSPIACTNLKYTGTTEVRAGDERSGVNSCSWTRFGVLAVWSWRPCWRVQHLLKTGWGSQPATTRPQ